MRAGKIISENIDARVRAKACRVCHTWELMTPGFTVGTPDNYNAEYRVQYGVIEEMIDGIWVPASAGTTYEETRCRNKEKEFLNTMQYLYDGMDWSYDPTNINQGKQYKD